MESVQFWAEAKKGKRKKEKRKKELSLIEKRAPLSICPTELY
jgi:hypothetical protein